MPKEARTFVIADLHLGHRAMAGKRGFNSVPAMNGAILAGWNEVVEPQDRVYLIGDVAMNRSQLPLVKELQGRKILIGGNHDAFHLREYAELFEDIRGAVDTKGAILTHIPVHAFCVGRWSRNVHGHLHDAYVYDINGDRDARYVCVSAEQIDYRPRLLSAVLA